MTTAYLRLYSVLRDQILNGDLRPGDQLPTEHRLCERFGVSRITCRHALRLLQEQGLVDRFPGRGTFVRAQTPPKIPIMNVDYPSAIGKSGKNIHRELVVYTEVIPPQHISDEFGMLKSEKCILAIRVDRKEKEALAFDRAYIPIKFATSLDRQMLERIDFLGFWIDAERLTVSHMTTSIEAIAADAEEERYLSVSKNTPMILTRDVFTTGNGGVAAVFETVYRGDMFKFVSTYTKSYVDEIIRLRSG